MAGQTILTVGGVTNQVYCTRKLEDEIRQWHTMVGGPDNGPFSFDLDNETYAALRGRYADNATSFIVMSPHLDWIRSYEAVLC